MGMKNELHVVLGAAGAIGSAVVRELTRQNLPVLAVERSRDVIGVKTLHADLYDIEQSKEVSREATHVYLCVGLPYSSKVWKEGWPRIMTNVISACEVADARLIFFDNMYLYGPSLSVPFDETTPQHPTKEKGLARKRAADALLEAHQSGRIKGLIGRSADFYGPGAVNSRFYITILKSILEGKKPLWDMSAGVPHTYAYSEDCARALVMLAGDESAYGEVWHLPVGEPITPDEILGFFNTHLGTSFRLQYLSPLMKRILALFIAPLRESQELAYQFNEPYVMSWEKLKKKYPELTATSYDEGVQTMIASFKT